MPTVQLLCTVFLVHFCSVLASEIEFFSIPADKKATSCGLDNSKIDTLAKANYWSVPFTREHLDKCFIPDGYERHQISSCQLHFSVCRSIPEGVCEGHPNSTACQEVVTEDGLRHYYGIGESQESYEFKPNGYPSSDGFFTVRHGNTVSHHRSRSCRGPFKISLKFVCDRDRVWDPISHDASTHVRVIVIFDHCHLEIEFGYSGACQRVAPTLAPAMNTCRLLPYDLDGLTKYDYWFVEVPNSFCYSNNADTVQTCNFTFAFCGTLPAKRVRPGCSGASVCQDGVVLREGLFYNDFAYSMGQFAGFSYNKELAGGGFLMNATNGTRIRNMACNIKTTIVLVCNSSAVWSSLNLTKIFRAEKTGPCEYQFVLPYSGACLPVFPNATILPSTAHPTMTTPSKINTTNIHPHPTTTFKPPPSSSHHHTINSTTKHPSSTPTRNSTTMTPTSTRSMPTSSPHHTTNSTTKHPSSTPTKNSTTMTPTSTRSMPTSSPHHTTNSTAKHPSSTPTKNSTTMTHTSSRHVATSTASFSPTAAPHVVTTNATPVDPDKRIVLGLTIGVVLFAALSVVLLVMVIIAVRVLIKKSHNSKFLKMES